MRGLVQSVEVNDEYVTMGASKALTVTVRVTGPGWTFEVERVDASRTPAVGDEVDIESLVPAGAR